MNHHRRTRAIPAALTAAVLVLQPTGAWAENKTFGPAEYYYVGQSTASDITGSGNDDLIVGDPPATLGPPQSQNRISTGFFGFLDGKDANGTGEMPTRHPGVFSPDGKRILFSSTATNIVRNFNTVAHSQIYSRAVGNPGDVIPLSVSSSGAAGNASTVQAVFSPDGSRVALVTKATNIAGQTGGSYQIIVVDLGTGDRWMVSKSRTNGDPGDDNSFNPVFSPNGGLIAFESKAKNLIPNGGSNDREIYLVDIGDRVDFRDYETIARLSSGVLGNSANGSSYNPVFSPNGKKVAFVSEATNYSSQDNDTFKDIIIKDINWTNHETGVKGATKLVSVFQDGSKACGADEPAFSPDGNAIAYVNYACNDLYPRQIFIKALQDWRGVEANAVIFFTLTHAYLGNDSSISPNFSRDGSRIAFSSRATNLLIESGQNQPSPDSGPFKIFVRDIADGKTEMISRHITSQVIQPNGISHVPVFSPNGREVAFESLADNLVDGDVDMNGKKDVYVTTIPSVGQADDIIFGQDGDDKLYGGGGHDRLTGGRGDDYLDGGEGNNDRAVYPKPLHRYEITKLAGGSIRVRDMATDPIVNQGTDILVGIEALQLTSVGTTDQIILAPNLQTGNRNHVPADKASIRIKAGRTSPPFIAATDPDGDPLTITMKTPPAHGTASLGADGRVTYTAPTGSAVKSTTFVLAASDSWGGSSDVTVTVGIGVTLRGTNGANALSGGPGNDVLIGKGGRDRLRGRAGADVFRFDRLSDSRPGSQRDVILDFRPAQGDKIDLSRIDANSRQGGNQAFTFIRGRRFNGTPGQLRFKNGVLSGDVNGNRKADFEIEVRTNAPLTAAHFKL